MANNTFMKLFMANGKAVGSSVQYVEQVLNDDDEDDH